MTAKRPNNRRNLDYAILGSKSPTNTKLDSEKYCGSCLA